MAEPGCSGSLLFLLLLFLGPSSCLTLNVVFPSEFRFLLSSFFTPLRLAAGKPGPDQNPFLEQLGCYGDNRHQAAAIIHGLVAAC